MNERKNTGTATSVPSESEVAERVEALLGRMSLAEKAGQLSQVGGAAADPDDGLRLEGQRVLGHGVAVGRAEDRHL